MQEDWCKHDRLIIFVAKRFLPFCGGACDMEDLLQAGRIGVHAAMATYEPEKGGFAPWAIYYIAREIKKALGILTKPPLPTISLDKPFDEEEKLTMGELIPDPAPNPAEIAERESVAAAIRARVNRLPSETQREILRRVDLEGQSQKKAAEEIGIERGNLYQQRQNAFRRLRRDPVLVELAGRKLDRETNWHYHKTLGSWKRDWMSGTERLAFWRIRQQEIAETSWKGLSLPSAVELDKSQG